MNEQITLIDVDRVLANGQEQRTETKRTVWAGVRSVTRSEFYQSQQAGLNAALVMKVNTEELGGAEYAEFEDRRYKILRIYRLDAQYSELTVEELKGVR